MSGFRHLLVWLVLLGPWLAHAADIYVATNGNDTTGTGTLASPYLTTVRGFQDLDAGETLFLRAGTWPQIRSSTHTMRSGTSYNPGQYLRVQAFPGETVVLRGLNIAANVAYWIWDGFLIDTNRTLGEGIQLTGGHHMRFLNLEIKNAIRHGVQIFYTSGGFFEFSNCDVHHNGIDGQTHGFYIHAGNNLVEYSKIHHNTGYGIQSYTSPPNVTANNNTYRYNEVYQNDTANDTSAGLLISSGTSNTAHDNLVYNNGSVGIQIAYGATNTLARNNRVFNNGTYGIHVFNTASATTVSDNLLTGNGVQPIRNDAGGSTTITNNAALGDTCAVVN